MTFIPSLLIEATNGIILVLLLYFLVFMAGHFVTVWNETRPAYGGPWGWLRTLERLRKDTGAEIALTVIILGFELRTIVLWAARHADNHQHDLRVLDFDGTPGVVIGTAFIIIGAMCWNRVMTPIRCPAWCWVLMVLVAFAFGVGMALY